MTQTQVNYQNYLENVRHNREMEALEYANTKIRGKQADIADYNASTNRLNYYMTKSKESRENRMENVSQFTTLAKGLESLSKAFKPLFQ